MNRQSGISREEVLTLGVERAEACASLYMPTEIKGRETRQNAIRFRKLLGQVRQRAGVDAMPRDLVELVDNEDFWKHQGAGLAVFFDVSAGREAEARAVHLPFAPEELVHIGPAYHVTPLLPILAADEIFYILLVSQKAVHLLQCTRSGYTEVPLGEVGRGREIIQQYVDPEQQQQLHTVNMSGAARGKFDPIFHGHGLFKDNDDVRIREFLRAVDEAVCELLTVRGHHYAPVIFAGVEHLLPTYRQTATSLNLLHTPVPGNHDLTSRELPEVYEQAMKIMEQRFAERTKDLKRRLEEAEVHGVAAERIEQVVPLAYSGMIETLALSRDCHAWGRFDEETGHLEVHDTRQDGDVDLANQALLYTLRSGGRVADLTNRAPRLAAIYRKGTRPQAAAQ